MLQMCFGYLLSVVSVSGFRIRILTSELEAMTGTAEGSGGWRQLAGWKGWKTFWLGKKKKTDGEDPLKAPFREPPPGVDLSSGQLRMYRFLHRLSCFSIRWSVAERTGYEYSATLLAPLYWTVDFAVLFALEEDHVSRDDPAPAPEYRRERLREYERNRKIVREVNDSQYVSLGLTSVWKYDRVSWLGICWRSFLVGGIVYYAWWFWSFRVLRLGETMGSCPTFVFLFSKASIFGGAGTFYQILSILYGIYGALLLGAVFLLPIAFLGTAFRSLWVSWVLVPCAKLAVFASHLGDERVQRQELQRFDRARKKYMERLGIPNVRQLLSGYAFLSSRPKQAELKEKEATNGQIRKRKLGKQSR